MWRVAGSAWREKTKSGQQTHLLCLIFSLPATRHALQGFYD